MIVVTPKTAATTAMTLLASTIAIVAAVALVAVLTIDVEAVEVGREEERNWLELVLLLVLVPLLPTRLGRGDVADSATKTVSINFEDLNAVKALMDIKNKKIRTTMIAMATRLAHTAQRRNRHLVTYQHSKTQDIHLSNKATKLPTSLLHLPTRTYMRIMSHIEVNSSNKQHTRLTIPQTMLSRAQHRILMVQRAVHPATAKRI